MVYNITFPHLSPSPHPKEFTFLFSDIMLRSVREISSVQEWKLQFVCLINTSYMRTLRRAQIELHTFLISSLSASESPALWAARSAQWVLQVPQLTRFGWKEKTFCLAIWSAVTHLNYPDNIESPLCLKLKLNYDRQSVGQSVLLSGTRLGLATNFSVSLKFSLDSCGLLFCSALSDERTGL
jgi:hypothetical protein